MKTADVIKNLGPAMTFFPGLAKALGSRNASILVSQLIYWQSEKREWVYKDSAEIEEHTSLTAKEQRRAREILVELGILKEHYQRSKFNVAFRIDRTRLDEVFQEHLTSEHMPKSQMAFDPKSPPLDPKSNALELKKIQNKQEDQKKLTRAARESDLVGGFFGGEQTWEQTMALELHEAICKAGKIQREPNLKQWAQWIGKLRLEASQTRVQKAIRWYSPKVGEIFLPSIFSGKSLYDKFQSLELAMNREKPIHTKLSKVSDESKSILSQVDSLSWPKGSKADLPALVESSLEAYRAFQRHRAVKVEWWRDNNPTEREDMIYFDKNVGLYVMGDNSGMDSPEEDFIIRWCHKVNEAIQNWAEWSGQMSYWHFAPTHSTFKKMVIEQVPDGNQFAEDYLRRMNQ